MFSRLVLRLSSLLLVSAVASGCASAGPAWTSETPEGFRFNYVAGYGEAESRAEAQASAELDARRQVGLRNSTIEVTNTTGLRAVETEERLSQTTTTETDVRSEGLPTQIEGWERVEIFESESEATGRHSVWALYRRLKPPGERRAPPGTGTFVVRNALLPGWGQRTMGRDAQGTLFTSVYLTAAATFGASHFLREQELERIRTAPDAAVEADAIDKANLWGNVRNVALGTAVGVWAWSVLDSFSATPQFLPFSVQPGRFGSTELGVRLRW